MGKIDHYQELIDKEIKKNKYGQKPESLYEPIRYLMELKGKRLRPMLTLLTYSLFKNNVKPALPYAIAVEAFHNFTLMHDDIMDNAPLRRGYKTVHEKWNVNTAILSGDVMLVKVYEIFSKLEPEYLTEVLKAFNRCAAEVCEGQQWDMEFECMDNVTEAQYISMIRQKTAVLLGFSLELGAILGGGTLEQRKALREFGINIGIGFQLKDDLLDAYADPKKFGKQVGGDILANKKTFLMIKALEKASRNQRSNLSQWLATKKKSESKRKIKAVMEIFNDLSISSITDKKINAYFKKGFQSLHKISTSLKCLPLQEFATELISRQT